MRYLLVITIAATGLFFLAKFHPLVAMIVAVVGLMMGFDGSAIYAFFVS